MIAICLATFNGELYLKEQLDSLLNQSYKEFDIFVRDDGSNDATLAILEEYKNSLTIIQDNKESSSAQENFTILLEYVSKLKKYEYFMLCDQDDVWLEDKVKKSIKMMRNFTLQNEHTPLLIHTDLQVVDAQRNLLHSSFWNYMKLNPSKNAFHQLLIQNSVTGCATIMNKALLEIALPIPKNVTMHDWWLALVASQFGKVIPLYDATILYRQHTNNTIGAEGFTPRYILQRFFKKNIFQKNIVQASLFLETYKKNLDKQTVQMLQDFINLNSKSFLKKRAIILKYKLFKHGIIRNIGLLVNI